jgi:hypothetical protein
LLVLIQLDCTMKVERAFYLLLNDDITIEGLQKSNSRRVKVGRTLNELTGKESTTGTAFSDGNWGDTTRQYLESVEDLNPEALAAILNEALDIFNRPNSRRSKSLAVAQETLGYEPNRRAHLVDLSSCDDDSDADCKRHPIFLVFLYFFTANFSVNP